MYGLLIQNYSEKVDVVELKMDFLKGETALDAFQKASRD